MKRILLITLNLALVGFFLYNLGLFNIRLPKLTSDGVANREHQLELNKFINEKIKLAESLGDKYSPDAYFTDLINIDEQKKKLSGTYKEQFMINRLWILSFENIRNERYSEVEITAARDKYKEYLDPGRVEREKLQAQINQGTFWSHLKHWLWSTCLPWLLWFYLKNLPLALVLFLIWWYKEYQTLRIKNPLSFITSVLLYPYVIGLMLYKRLKTEARYLSLEVELRKTKTKFFTLLAQDEVAEMRRLAHSNFRIKEWRNYLANRGFTPQQSGIRALGATILLSTITLLIYAAPGKQVVNSDNSWPTSLMVKINPAPPGASNVMLGSEKIGDDQISPHDFIEPPTWPPPRLQVSATKLFGEVFSFYKFLFQHPIEHIPLFS